MIIVNLDDAFEAYLKHWMQVNADRYGNNMDKMEEAVPDVYMEFLKTPLASLNGQTPEAYFGAITDAGELVDMLRAYILGHTPVPDLLLERIVETGEDAVPLLLDLIRNPDEEEEIRMTAVSLMQEIGGSRPRDLYIDLIAPLEESSDLGDICAESLCAMGREVVDPVLARYEGAGKVAKDIFADVLCNFPGDDRIYAILEERFRSQTDQRALFASYLAKYGDERALPVLLEASRLQGLGYL
ncbi:MAG: hypothetical protein IJ088_12530, partial [Clostridia bacterium]|nr:hypothetical protein [Clostridia bacterium]